MKNEFYLSLGSNMGDREEFIRSAIKLLNTWDEQKLKLTKCSSFYETEPVGYEDQSAFINIVVQGHTLYTPEELLHITQTIEKKLGRVRVIHWGPRVIDIDILLYNSIRMYTDHLVIPHPRMAERAFVLVPLAEIAADLTLPGDSHTIGKRIQTVGKEGVRLWKTN